MWAGRHLSTHSKVRRDKAQLLQPLCKHQLGTQSIHHHPDLPTPKRTLTISCPSQLSTAALPHTALSPPACQAGGCSSRGSRWLSPPLQGSPSTAAGSFQLLAADGGTTAAARAAQAAARQSACLPAEWSSAHWVSTHHTNSLCYRHTSIPPTFAQTERARSLSAGVRTLRGGSPTMPVIDHTTWA